MEVSMNNLPTLLHFTFENTKHKLGVRIWGDRTRFHELHELLGECWCCKDEDMSPQEADSSIGVVSYFSYEVRHAFMGDRLVKLDGKPLKSWSDEMYQLFEKEQRRFEVGMELTWPHILFIMASWWESIKRKECPVRVLPTLRMFTENIEQLLQQRSQTQYSNIEPYIHGAIYSSNPHLMHTMEHVNVNYLSLARFGNTTLNALSNIMECSAFGSFEYENYMATLKRHSHKLGCSIEELREKVDEKLYDVEL